MQWWYKITGHPKTRKTSIIILVFLTLVALFLCISPPQFQTPKSTVVLASDESLLGAHIANDGQWRFPAPETLPEKYKKALLCFEDEYFFYHPGINPVSLARAMIQNSREGKIISGGSTITMQVARMSENRPRTIGNKLWEMIKAIRLEATHSKQTILLMYAANAPFGGNIVGFETASWHYFQRPPKHLTWAESALLAVLPNAPGQLRPGTNTNLLKAKRNLLLNKLHEKGHIDSTELKLSVLEPLPKRTRKLPDNAPHLVDYFLKTQPGKTIKTTINSELQALSAQTLQQHSNRMSANHIRHAGAVILEVESGNVVAYIGNSKPSTNKAGHAVDMVRAHRSSGSILKPFLYASALQNGTILPNMLLADVPTQYRNYTPRNFHRKFDGAVPAGEALSRSLNVPFVRLLHKYGGERFLKKLQQIGISTITKEYDHYGLSLILGGGEVSLWELAGGYASMGRILKHYSRDNSRYRTHDIRPPNLISQNNFDDKLLPHPPVLSAGPIWWTFEAMRSVVRPPEESGWENFTSQQNIAWKTGTSFGYRDAWSVGINGDYVIAVWVGNASGEGRSGLLGGTTAGPLMFRLFGLLPRGNWFDLPHDDMSEVPVCSKSGHRASPQCPNKEIQLIPNTVKSNRACPYHKLVHLTPDRRYRTRRSCQSDGQIITESRFVLPPLMGWFYSQQNSNYKFLPPMKPGCFEGVDAPMDFIYPNQNATVIVPVDLNGEKQKVIFKAVHAQPGAIVFWHLNNKYIGQTRSPHEIELNPKPGKYRITIIDNDGNQLARHFNVLD